MSLLALSAHVKGKHRRNSVTPTASKKNKTVVKLEVECDICNFTSHRRDYIEHHVRAKHKIGPNSKESEFSCDHCTRNFCTYNRYILHLHSVHSKPKEEFISPHMCFVCKKASNVMSLKQHFKNKHETPKTVGEFDCVLCNVRVFDSNKFQIHLDDSIHKALKVLREGQFNGKLIKEEPSSEESTVIVFKTEADDEGEVGNETDECKTDNLNESHEEPPEKVARIETRRLSISNEDNKLEYLKYLHKVNGVYKCGICSKTKPSRKYILRHIKQHKEVPTYNCSQCPVKFVIKKKYLRHLENHEENNRTFQMEQDEETNVDEHPRFQEITHKPEIKCQTCQMTFRLTIMLNRHNSLWHADDNPHKDLTMNQQKHKKHAQKLEPEVSIIKLFRCNQCQDTFFNPRI